MWEKAWAAKSPPPVAAVVVILVVGGGRWGAFSGVVYLPRLVITMMDLSSDWSCVPYCAHVRLFFLWSYGTLLYFFAFSARNGQTDNQKLSPTSHHSVSDRIASDSVKIQAKRKRMMGYIKNSPQTKMSRFFVRQRLPAK
jgi:hypothetical protein